MSTLDTRRPQFFKCLSKKMMIAWALAGAGTLLAACGTGVATPGVAVVGSTTTTSASPSPQSGNSGSKYSDGLAYSQCMRSHGVPNYPDPSANGSFQFNNSVDPSSPIFVSAQAHCDKYLPGGGFPTPGSRTNPSPGALAQFIKVARCMREHGISQFPDPTTKVPTMGPDSGVGVVSDRDGVILVFPGTLDMHSIQFTHAAAECKFSLTNHH